MPIYRVQGPDGKIHRFEGPAGAKPEEIEAFAAQQFKAAPPASAEPASDPSEGGGTLNIGPFDTGVPTSQGVDRFLSGMGAGMSHMGRGIGQAVGLSDQAAVDEAQRLEQPLQATGAGRAGDVIGRIATVAPTALIPGANTMAGAAAIGGVTGLAATEGGIKDRVIGGAVGAVAAPVGLLAGRLIGAAGRAAKAAVADPFTKAGQERIAARTLQEFAGGATPARAAGAQLAKAPQTLPGVMPTAGELTDNAGIAQLERTLRQNPELAQAFTERLSGNRGALIGVVDDIAGNDAQMTAAVAARRAATQDGYRSATQADYVIDDALRDLLQRPVMRQAMTRAQQMAANQGRPLTTAPNAAPDPLYAGSGNAPVSIGQMQQMSGQSLQDLKMAIDAMLKDPTSGIAGKEAAVVQGLRGQLLSWMENANPAFRAARTQYADMSRPINQMEIGHALRERLVPALADYGAPRTNAATFANALRDGDLLAARATGMPNATLENTLSPQQQNLLQQVAEQLGRRARADELGRIQGSPTAQNLVSQNLLRQVLGPLGLPESFAENTLLQSILRPAQFVGRLGEERVINRLAQAALDPQDAATLLMRVQPNNQAITNALAQGLRVSGTAAGSN